MELETRLWTGEDTFINLNDKIKGISWAISNPDDESLWYIVMNVYMHNNKHKGRLYWIKVTDDRMKTLFRNYKNNLRGKWSGHDKHHEWYMILNQKAATDTNILIYDPES